MLRRPSDLPAPQDLAQLAERPRRPGGQAQLTLGLQALAVRNAAAELNNLSATASV
jgi:hypothetical protein